MFLLQHRGCKRNKFVLYRIISRWKSCRGNSRYPQPQTWLSRRNQWRRKSCRLCSVPFRSVKSFSVFPKKSVKRNFLNRLCDGVPIPRDYRQQKEHNAKAALSESTQAMYSLFQIPLFDVRRGDLRERHMRIKDKLMADVITVKAFCEAMKSVWGSHGMSPLWMMPTADVLPLFGAAITTICNSSSVTRRKGIRMVSIEMPSLCTGTCFGQEIQSLFSKAES